jgi:hypothetical protein
LCGWWLIAEVLITWYVLFCLLCAYCRGSECVHGDNGVHNVESLNVSYFVDGVHNVEGLKVSYFVDCVRILEGLNVSYCVDCVRF